jgi:hypothetical protein
MGRRTPLRLGVVIAVALGLLAVVSAASAAQDPTSIVSSNSNPLTNTQTTNVPYLAWRGEYVTVVKCDYAYSADSGETAQFMVEDWSGDPIAQPQLIPGTNTITTSEAEAGGAVSCAKATFTSLKAGLTQIKLQVLDRSGGLVGDPHQFLVAWLGLNQPTVSGGGDVYAGDPGLPVSVHVTGNLPLGNNYGTDLGLGSSLTLPDDWKKLAQVAATDQNPQDLTPWMRWDIHDGLTATSQHVLGACTKLDVFLTDAVTNCLGGDQYGPFSRVFGDTTDSELDITGNEVTAGPYDPLHADQTLLSDGNLDAGDAPMPAARIDVRIADNSTAMGDISGVGYLTAADKTKIDSVDGLGSPTADNLYAPFYGSYIPATARTADTGDLASGVDGLPGNNFPGFLNTSPLYHYWDIAQSLAWHPRGSTNCLRRSWMGYEPQFRLLPSGNSDVAVYTDEHGDAVVNWNPGTGMYYDQFGVKNDNGGCDLQGIDKIGTAAVTATAVYPYQPVFTQPIVSKPVSFTVHSKFSKTLAVYPKGPGADNAVARIVVAHAVDVDGTPFANEHVCFMADHNAEGMKWFHGITGPANARIDLSNTSLSDSDPDGLGRLCVMTDENGYAGVEVFNSNPTKVNVIADFADEGLLRHVFVDYGTPPVIVPPIAVPPTPTQVTQAVAVSASGPVAAATPKKKAPAVKRCYRLANAKVLFPAGGHRSLVVRVNGKQGMVAIRVTLHSKLGAKQMVRFIPTNRLVQVANVPLNRLVSAVKVHVLFD